jgi:CRISPR-associated protein Cmr2
MNKDRFPRPPGGALMTGERILHLSLGPVQAFVAQARRTRDFWAGSFLLSTLAAVAMREVRAQDGKVLFPRPDEEFLRALSGQSVERTPQQGVAPNRFKASVPPEFDPGAVCQAVRLAWVGVAGLAWKRLPERIRDGHEGLRRVWSRQIGVDLETGEPHERDPFWQISWALGGEADGEDLLDRRKHLRTAMPPSEAGAKCMLMEGWQELSGVERPSGDVLEAFWKPVREHVNGHNKSDLVDGEQLCALSFVKRVFPHVFDELEPVPMPGGWAFSGWKLATGVPSVAYLAAAPWLARAVAAIDEARATKFIEASQPLDAGSERRTKLRLVEDAVQTRPGLRAFAHLDGSLFFESSLAAEYLRELKADGMEEGTARGVIDRATSALRAIRELRTPTLRNPEATLGAPRPEFAVLAMDGDDLGRNMAQPEKQPAITEALARFASKAPEIVERHSGFLVYAGGDDVRALLPVPGALHCARELRSHYESCFAGTEILSTLSGAVLFAHHKLPLGHVLHEAHELLDGVAKDGRGRDAIAVQVSTRGGDLLRWAQPWAVALGEGEALVLEGLAAQMAAGEAPFSHRFFHRIEALLRLVNADPARGSDPLDEQTAIDVFTAELLDSSRYRDRPAAGEKAAGTGGDEAAAGEGIADGAGRRDRRRAAGRGRYQSLPGRAGEGARCGAPRAMPPRDPGPRRDP